ncbi:MAG: hypothetical protein AAF483_24155 [Planctomycetota bacterium]
MKDLEKFLQQAAEKLADTVNQGQPPQQQQQQQPRRQQQQQPRQPRNVRQAERAPLSEEIVEAEVIDAALAGPDPISAIDTRHLDPAVTHRPELATNISQADERMTSHVQQVVDHDIVHIRDASDALDGTPGPTIVPKKNPIVEMLKSPDSIRKAFIASQIFQRKFD